MATIDKNFTPDEQNIAAGQGVTDPEFDKSTNSVCWQDGGRLYVAPIDPVTGNILLTEKVLLDIGLAPIARDESTDTGTGNGPEWILTKDGSDILYTKAVTSDPNTWEVWRATLSGSEWNTQSLVTGSSPNGTASQGDSDAKFVFRQADSEGNFDLVWYDYYSGEAGLVTPERTKGARWVNGESDQLVYAQEVNGTRQVFLYDVNLDQTQQLTFGGTDKSKPWIFKAPERDGDLVLMFLEDAKSPQTLSIYEESNGNWSQLLELRPPTGRDLIYSPEPVIYEGRSGISFVAKDELSIAAESEVWLAGWGPSGPVYRKISEQTSLARNDPETFATNSELFVYYNVRSTSLFDGTPPSLFRASTGVLASAPSAMIAGGANWMSFGSANSKESLIAMDLFRDDQFVSNAPFRSVARMNLSQQSRLYSSGIFDGNFLMLLGNGFNGSNATWWEPKTGSYQYTAGASADVSLLA